MFPLGQEHAYSTHADAADIIAVEKTDKTLSS